MAKHYGNEVHYSFRCVLSAEVERLSFSKWFPKDHDCICMSVDHQLKKTYFRFTVRDRSFFVVRKAGGFCNFRLSQEKSMVPKLSSFYLVTHPIVHVFYA